MTAPPHCETSCTDERPHVRSTQPLAGCKAEEVNVGPPIYNKRKCGCLRTSEKLKQILGTFPSPPPPTPMGCTFDKASGYNYGHVEKQYMAMTSECCTGARKFKRDQGKSWRIVAELVSLVQLSVTATALALYYLIYCYMQVVYYTLRSALYFHNADGPMKITIGVVTVTSLIVGFNILMRMERIIGIVY